MTDLETLRGASELVISQRISDLIKELGYPPPIEHEAIEKALLKIIPPLEELLIARKALEFYADEANWRYRHDVAAYDDKGQRAREALAKLGSEALQSRGDEISGRVKGE